MILKPTNEVAMVCCISVPGATAGEGDSVSGRTAGGSDPSFLEFIMDIPPSFMFIIIPPLTVGWLESDGAGDGVGALVLGSFIFFVGAGVDDGTRLLVGGGVLSLGGGSFFDIPLSCVGTNDMLGATLEVGLKVSLDLLIIIPPFPLLSVG